MPCPSLTAKSPCFILGALTLTLLYALFLLFQSQMMIDSDAKAYQNLGILFKEEGWTGYLTTGPNREPGYPLLIAFSMTLAEFLPWSYQKVQTVFQILFLVSTQFLVWRLFTRCRVPPAITAGTILYLGFSPAMVNSVFSLYSEIITYPFVLLLVLTAARAWTRMRDETAPSIRLVPPSFLLGGLLTLLTLMKASFEVIGPFFLFPFLLFAGRTALRKNFSLSRRALTVFSVSFGLFFLLVSSYKCLNWKANGHFAVTDRGAWAFFGNAKRRVQPLTPGRLKAAIAITAGERACTLVAAKEDCLFWSPQQSDFYSMDKMQFIARRGAMPEDMDKILLLFSEAEIADHPFQYAFFMGVEALKIFFWESTRIGWVIYPEPLNTLFSFRWLSNGLRLLLAVVSLLGLWGLGREGLARGRLLTPGAPPPDERASLAFFAFWLIIGFAAAHSFFVILSRYLFPLVPLYLFGFALLIDSILRSKRIQL